MRRRDFIAVLGGAAAAAGSPFAALAQRQTPLIGFLNSASPDSYRFNADSFREGLAKAGFVESPPMSELRNGGLAATTAHCLPLQLNSSRRAWSRLPPREMLLQRGRRSWRAAQCLSCSRLAANG